VSGSEKVCVSFIWHFHQPLYADGRDGSYILPWVRLHAIKDYIGLGLIASEFPDVRQTFNFVPSLVRQLRDYAGNGFEDKWGRLARVPADSLSEKDVWFVIDHFFAADWERMIKPLPRYAQLLEKRRPGRITGEMAARNFNAADLRDLQVLSILSWFHPKVLERREDLRALVAKCAYYTEADKAVLFHAQHETLSGVTPLFRRLEEAGTVELTSTPYYHPILPLLCDQESAREAIPAVSLPSVRFDGRADAMRQLQSAAAFHEETFGRRPRGLWPSEGSVSPDMAPLVAQAGFRWMASDEEVLANSVGVAIHRDRDQRVTNPDVLYRPYSCPVENCRLSIVFRDHYLSDLIGFQYHRRGNQAESASDMLARLRAARGSGSDAPPLVCVILDGENAWEHYDGQGVEFLNGLLAGLRSDPMLEAVSVSDYIERYGVHKELPRLYSGSWIYGNFATWIGQPEKNMAWERIAETRRRLVRAGGPDDSPALATAWEELYAAEGSDWFWWYGTDHQSAYDETFDELFRLHLKNAHRFAGLEAPDVLDVPITRHYTSYDEPRCFIKPVIDGRRTHYFEWTGAGLFDCSRQGSAMLRASGGLVSRLRFGFDERRLFLKLDFTDKPAWLNGNGWTLDLNLVEPSESAIRVRRRTDGRFEFTIHRGGEIPVAMAAGVETTLDECLEIALPFDAIGVRPGQSVAFCLEIERGGNIVEQVPSSSLIRFTAPGGDFERIMWMV